VDNVAGNTFQALLREADRVIDPSFGRTDVGKVMLEADLLLKKTAARLLHPDHPLGRAVQVHLDVPPCCPPSFSAL
jgi:hypothetical protein